MHLVADTEARGRPRLRSDDEILVAALHAFAANGFEGMSLRALNTDLGLSNGTINQRFGSKQQLYIAAIDHGFATFRADIAAELERRGAPHDDLDELRELLRAFLVVAAGRPELGRLMNSEGLHASDRLAYFERTVLLPGFGPIDTLLTRLESAGRINPTPTRLLFFLIAHGAEAPYTLTALSDAFDQFDGPLDAMAHDEAYNDVIIRGISR
jgi:AcrR family transcriptional regulator